MDGEMEWKLGKDIHQGNYVWETGTRMQTGVGYLPLTECVRQVNKLGSKFDAGLPPERQSIGGQMKSWED